MAINFCHPAFCTFIACDKPCTDGYEVTQLVTEAGVYGTRGFLAENFIRPPVCVALEFPCFIDLEKILIQATVSSQASNGFEVLVSSPKISDLKRMSCDDLDKPPRKSYAHICDGKTFFPIGKLFNRAVSVFEFGNARFCSRAPYADCDGMTSSIHSKSASSILRHPTPVALRSVQAIIIRILQVQSGSVPCIGRLEVWGQPANTVNKATAQKILTTFKTIMNPVPRKDIHVSEPPSFVPCSEGAPKVTTTDPLQIPEDFLDAITHDVMSLPVVLPSGNVVDQSTVEKHNAVEASWGRPPNDPFTGIPFTEKKGLCFNSALKVRIDQFLLKHGDEVDSCGRTVGRARDQCNSHIVGTEVYQQSNIIGKHFIAGRQPARMKAPSLPCYPHSGLTRTSHYSRRHISKHHPFDIATETLTSSPLKRRQVAEDDLFCPKKKTKCDLDSWQHPEQDTLITDVKSHDAKKHPTSHTRKLHDSLNDALEKALGHLPALSCASPVSTTHPLGHTGQDREVDEVLQTHCSSCGEGSQLGRGHGEYYQMLCQHVICRACLLSKKESVQCDVCQVQCERKDVTKVHM